MGAVTAPIFNTVNEATEMKVAIPTNNLRERRLEDIID
jgi:hypothetical protein